jgi:tetratricopeptide (TPR) repeat protein
MMDHAIVLEALGRTDADIAEYEQTLTKTPSGYYPGQELVAGSCADRRRGQLATAITRLEKRWPDRARGYFEWVTLGDLYKEAHDDDRAVEAYKRAVAKAPTEVATQRKLIALLDKVRPAEALAQHEAAARVAPGDADLQIELAKRYHSEQAPKAFNSTRPRSARAGDVWRAEHDRSALRAMERPRPRDRRVSDRCRDRAGRSGSRVVLGDAYWRAEHPTKARRAGNGFDKMGTPISLFRHAKYRVH